ncbi:hypothetical protein CRUP_008587, partial [Coryphaenoides rupestris]
FSINRHFYNYKTSIFTPSFGTATKVRITSQMGTHQVIEQLLHKFKGPSEDIMKVFLMDSNEQEVSNDVAQYLNLELPILQQVLIKLTEQENREILTTMTKYHKRHGVMSRLLSSHNPPIETSV